MLDFTQALSGPYCTLVLADLGADVVKLESPGRGDDSRHWGPPFLGKTAAYFHSVNRNKRSVAVDLKTSEGVSIARDLARVCDVVVENWRPGVAGRLGVGYASLRQGNPGLIYCSLSGFGQAGPPRPGYDQVIQGMSGVMSVTGQPDGPPTKAGIGLTDIASGMFCAHAVLAALYERKARGNGAPGRQIDVAMLDAAVALLAYQATRYTATGEPPERSGNYHTTIAPYATFSTSDGYVNVCVANDEQWRRFCGAIGATDLLADARFGTNPGRVAHRDVLYPLLEELISGMRSADLLAVLEEAAVPVGPVRKLDDVFADPGLRARGMALRCTSADGTIEVPGAPWHIDGMPLGVRIPPPALGAHTIEVLSELGYDEQRISLLREKEIIVAGD